MARQVVVAKVYDKRGKLLATGHNSYTKTHPRQADLARRAGFPRKHFLHAEVAAIINAQKRGVPYSIKVERRNRLGQTGLAAPCSICTLAIQEAGIKYISFTA